MFYLDCSKHYCVTAQKFLLAVMLTTSFIIYYYYYLFIIIYHKLITVAIITNVKVITCCSISPDPSFVAEPTISLLINYQKNKIKE